MREWIESLGAGRDLSVAEAESAAEALLEPGRSDGERADFLRALSAKGESPAEIEGFVAAFLRHAVDPGLVEADLPGPAIDIVGTGGDRLNLFNVSTTAMFVLAGGGACVVKHGNRAVTSHSGGADVLEALGVRIDLPPARFAECVRQAGLGFLFAPLYHPAFKVIGPARRQLAAEGLPSILNLLGPLLNPARPSRQLIGVYEERMGPMLATQMERLGRKSAWVVYGNTEDGAGMDECSALGPTAVWAWDGRAHSQHTLHPREHGLEGGTLAYLTGGDAAANAAITRGILDGTIRDARRRMAALNAAAGFVVAGLAPDLETGLARAREAIDSGAAEERLAALVRATQGS